jgi:hypothetical protein
MSKEIYLPYASVKHCEEDLTKKKKTESRILSIEDLLNLKEHKKASISNETYRGDLSDFEPENSGFAIQNFDEYLNTLTDDKAEVDNLRVLLAEKSFEETSQILENEILNAYGINNGIQDTYRIFRNEVSEDLDYFWETFKAKCIELFKLSFLNNSQKNLLGFIKLNKSRGKKIEKCLEEVKTMFYQIYFSRELDEYSKLPETKELFEELRGFLLAELDTIPEKLLNLNNAIRAIDNIAKETHNILRTQRNDLYVFSELAFLDFSPISKTIIDRQKLLLNNFGLEKKVIKEKEKIYDNVQSIFSNPDPIYLDDIGNRKKNKLLIFLCFEKLFLDVSERRDENSVKKIRDLLFLVEPSLDNASPLLTKSFPSTFISDAEVRALRMFFVSCFSGFSDPKESFKHKEIAFIKSIFKELDHEETVFASISNSWLAVLKDSNFSTFQKLSEAIKEEILNLEHGLVVRDCNSGFNTNDYEKQTFVSVDGESWIEKLPQGILPNYTPSLRAHSFTKSQESLYTDISRPFNDISLIMKDYIDSFSGDSNFSLMEDLEKIEPSIESFEEIIRLINAELSDENRLDAEKKRNVFYCFIKIGEILSSFEISNFSKEKEDFFVEALKEIFEKILGLLSNDLSFETVEVLTLRYYLLNKLIKTEGSSFFPEWNIALFHNLFELRHKYEELLSSFLPYIDKIESVLYLNLSDSDEVISWVLNELRSSEYVISGRFFDNHEKKVHMDALVNLIRSRFSPEEQNVEKMKEVMKLANSLKRYAIPSAAIFFIISFALTSIQKVMNEDEKQDHENIENLSFVDLEKLLAQNRSHVEEIKSTVDDTIEIALKKDLVVEEEEDEEELRKGPETVAEEALNKEFETVEEWALTEEFEMIAQEVLAEETETGAQEVLAENLTSQDLHKAEESVEKIDIEPEIKRQARAIDQKTLLKKYESGELPFLSTGEKDDLGYKIMIEHWPGVSDLEEAREIFLSLDMKDRARFNKLTSESLRLQYGQDEINSLLELRDRVKKSL